MDFKTTKLPIEKYKILPIKMNTSNLENYRLKNQRYKVKH